MPKRYGEGREISRDRIKSAEPIRGLVFDLAKTCQSVRLLKFKCGSLHRHPIVSRRDPQQLESRFGANPKRTFASFRPGSGRVAPAFDAFSGRAEALYV